jgi:hypothetical protein
MKNVENQRLTHSKFVSTMFEKKNLGFIDKAIASELSGLWWEKLRYKKGADNEIYKTSDFSATGDQPNQPYLATTVSSILAPIVPAVIIPVAPTEVAAIASPVVASTSLLSTSQTKDLAVKPTTTSEIALPPTYPPLSTKKHSGGFRKAGIAFGTILVIAVIGYFIIKKDKNPKLVEKQAQAEILSSN